MNLKGLMLAASLAAAGLTATPAAALTVGSSDGSNCYPFACNDGAESFDFYQIYSSEAFGGGLSFDTITFFGAFTDLLPAPQFLAGDYEISFGLTQDAVGTTGPLSLSNVTAFYAGSLGGSDLSIQGAKVSYNPGAGNLVMRVQVSGQAATPNDPFTVGGFAADFSLVDVSRAGRAEFADPNESYDLYSDGALVTGFSTTGTGIVPEPGAWALMIMGFGFTGAALRARRRSPVRTA